MNKETEFYVVYSPKTCNYILQNHPEPPFYLAWGYYISGCPFEPENIIYKGAYEKCKIVVAELCYFTMN